MPNLWVIFLTGLTTGGLSCLAVQGGLLANVIAHQSEEEYKPRGLSKKPGDPQFKNKHEMLNYYETKSHALKQPMTFRSDVTLSILLFLAAKVTAYTLLGFLLGWVGTMIQLGPIARGILMLFIAVFMLGTALRMLNVHPIFNWFNIQPPKFIRNFIRKFSKNAREDFATPIFLGTLTVLIPCGVTQAMMALALSLGNPAAGALTMLVFTLGTTPLFFFLAYTTTRLGEKLSGHFVKLVAILVLIFSLYSLESGLNLVGSPISYNATKQRWAIARSALDSTENTGTVEDPSTSGSSGPSAPSDANAPQELTINVIDSGYSPAILRAKANRPTNLKLVTNETYSCSRALVFPSLRIQKLLPETGTETLSLPAQRKGQLRFSCSMGMYTGTILFE